jgi:hypothetical protein
MHRADGPEELRRISSPGVARRTRAWQSGANERRHREGTMRTTLPLLALTAAVGSLPLPVGGARAQLLITRNDVNSGDHS